MASLWKSLSNMFREKKDQAAKAVGDDVRDGKFAIQDAKAQISGFRGDIAKFVAANKSVERDMNQALADVKKWDSVHQQASAAGNSEDAAAAQLELTNAKRRAIEFKKQFDVNSTSISNLRTQLSKAEQKVTNAESDHVQLAARKKGATIRKELAQASSAFGTGDSPLSQLDSLRESVEADEDEASAMEEITVSGSDDLASKYEVADGALDDNFDSLFGNDKKSSGWAG